MTVPRFHPAVLFFLRHAGLGFAIAAATVAGILLLDAEGLGALLTDATHHPGPLLLLWFFLGLTFGSAQIAFAVMQMAEAEPKGPGGGFRARGDGRPVPVRIRR